MIQKSFEERCVSLLGELDLAKPDEIRAITPLTGGVASDIAKVKTLRGDFCVKFALAKLKVSEDWQAPVHRNAAEYMWLHIASEFAPGYFPKLFGQSRVENGFAMEFVSGEGVFLWKDALLNRGAAQDEAASVARILGVVHQYSSKPEFDRTPFDNAVDFEALRLDPYLRFTAGVHPDVATLILEMADELFASGNVLVHGDVSPKNILFRNSDPILLDAECATMGDASFDVAFCINHLVIKAIHLPDHATGLLAAARSFRDTYFDYVDWEPREKLEARIAKLLPMLMLARVDGKSPVEYLSEPQREIIREFSLAHISSPTDTLGTLFHDIKEAIDS